MEEAASRARRVRLLVLDVDGVLTNGQIIYGSGGLELKVFHAQDGLGVSVARRAGLATAIITGRESEMVQRRGSELKMVDVYQKALDKVASLRDLCARHSLSLAETGYVGDDLNDLPAMRLVGFAAAVANAVPEVKRHAHYVASREGGRGAVREIIEFILRAQGKWDTVVAQYLQDPAGERQ